jgi:hypothetical protein
LVLLLIIILLLFFDLVRLVSILLLALLFVLFDLLDIGVFSLVLAHLYFIGIVVDSLLVQLSHLLDPLLMLHHVVLILLDEVVPGVVLGLVPDPCLLEELLVLILFVLLLSLLLLPQTHLLLDVQLLAQPSLLHLIF